MIEMKTADGIFSAVPTGMEARRFSGVDTVSLKKSQGFLVSPDGTVSDWQIEKFIEKDGMIFAIGPRLEGLYQWDPRSGGPSSLTILLKAVRALGTQGYPLGGLYLPAVQTRTDGSLFIAPPKLMTWIQENSPDKELDIDWNRWNHPDLIGEEAWSFSFGMLAWNLLGETDPCRDEIGEERRERFRSEVIPSILILEGRLDQDVAETIDRALCPGKERRSTLSNWESLISHWSSDGILRDIPKENAVEISDSAERVAQRKNKRLQGMRWARKSLWKYLVSAAVLAAVLGILSAPVGKALETPSTAGMTSLEVAATFYMGIDSLDSEIMDDCLAGKVGKSDRQHVDMMFVTSKVRQGYEGISSVPRAEDWLAEGRPELQDGVWPWGITDLELEKISETQIIARYEMWFPLPDGILSEAQGERRIDTLGFREGRRSWEIISIERDVLAAE